jgi:hypothetical protein
MQESFELDSNMMLEREEQPMKHISQSRSTEDGMEIDESERQSRRAPTSIHDSLELDSKVTVEREEQPLKHSSQSRSTECGMEIDKSETQS